MRTYPKNSYILHNRLVAELLKDYKWRNSHEKSLGLVSSLLIMIFEKEIII